MSPDYFVKHLQLLPHPEGGFYKETYRSDELIHQTALPKGFEGDRNVSTAIYFLIEQHNFSALHKIKSDEMWHFYAGDALEVIEISEDGMLKSSLLGNNLQNGETFQYLVKANTWFGSRVKKDGVFSLVGCTVAPGFDFMDFEMADRNALTEKFPQHKIVIEEMTRV
jgi:hypothetical protein